jgi:hypothetical protein|tara:strand:- start:255 stop:419 length:165 start_codon:yes stop_codon:yes gene_type:complete
MNWQDILKADFKRLDNIALRNLYSNLRRRRMMTAEDTKFIMEIEQEMKQRGMIK